MARIRLTKIFRLETAHILSGYDGDCKNIHGHSYRLYVTVSGVPNKDSGNPKQGMVMDFGELKDIVFKEIVEIFDHALLINKNSVLNIDNLKSYTEKLVLTDYQPTCENILIDFSQRIKKCLTNDIKLYSLKLYETDSSYGEWFDDDNQN